MALKDTAQGLMEFVRKVDNADLHAKILDLQKDVLDSIHEKAELQAKVRELEDEIRSLQESRDLEEQRVFAKDCYWLDQEDGGEPDGPYCSKCWDAEDKRMRMQKLRPGWAVCPNCRGARPVWPEDEKPVETRRRTKSWIRPR